MNDITETDIRLAERRLTPEQLQRGYDRLLDDLAELQARDYRAAMVRRCGLHAGQMEEDPERFDGGPI